MPFASRLWDGSDTLFVAEPAGGTYSERTMLFANDTRFLQEIDIVFSDPSHLRIIPSRCTLGTGRARLSSCIVILRILTIFRERLISSRVDCAPSIQGIPVALKLYAGSYRRR